MRSRQTGIRLTLTETSIQRARREVTKHAEFITKIFGSWDLLKLYNLLDCLEETLRNKEEITDVVKCRLALIKSFLDFCRKYPLDVFSGPLYRLDIFSDYEKKIKKPIPVSPKSGEIPKLSNPTLEECYIDVEDALKSLINKRKIECGMVIVNDKPRNFCDPLSEDGLTFVVRMKVKKQIKG